MTYQSLRTAVFSASVLLMLGFAVAMGGCAQEDQPPSDEQLVDEQLIDLGFSEEASWGESAVLYDHPDGRKALLMREELRAGTRALIVDAAGELESELAPPSAEQAEVPYNWYYAWCGQQSIAGFTSCYATCAWGCYWSEFGGCYSDCNASCSWYSSQYLYTCVSYFW